MSATRLSRRALLLGAFLAGPAFAAGKPKPGGDNGIGGTGYAPTDNGIGGTGYRPTDNGIGGTGFIGVIRKFGSVYVNGARISYAPDAEVLIDGAPAQIADLRLGQSTRIVAIPSGEDFSTRRIEVVSEAVGRVDRISGRWVSVLGQQAYLPSAAIARQIRPGDRIAISGLRRPDQTILATAVERREGVRDQVAGLLSRDAAGGLRIGGQSVSGVDPALAGGRVRVVGAREGASFVAHLATPDGPAALGAVQKFSIETFVARDRGTVTTASGLTVENLGGAGLARPQLVVMTGALASDRNFIADKISPTGPGGGFEPPRGGGGGFGGGGGGFGPGGGAPNGAPAGSPHGALPGASPGGSPSGVGRFGGGAPGNMPGGGVLPTPGGNGAANFSGFGGVPGANGGILPTPNPPIGGGASPGAVFGNGAGLPGAGSFPGGSAFPNGVASPGGAFAPGGVTLPNGAVGAGPFGGFSRGH